MNDIVRVLRTRVGLFVTGLFLAGCATPGIEYAAQIPPGNTEAARYRTVAVDQFSGPLGGWYADQFEQMLQGAYFNDEPWFTVGLFAGQSNVVGVYSGSVALAGPDIHESFHTETRCLERDKNKKCIKREEIERICVHYEMAARVSPVLRDRDTGTVIHRRDYFGDASESECFDTGFVRYRVRRQPGDPGRGKFRTVHKAFNHPFNFSSGDYIIDRLAARALRETLGPVRRDLAPYNKRARARILDTAFNPAIAADGRFEGAVEAIRDNDPDRACTLFEALDAQYPDDPALLFNLGACAEASGQGEIARGHYLEAMVMADAFEDSPQKRMLTSLMRVRDQIRDDDIIERILSAGEENS